MSWDCPICSENNYDSCLKCSCGHEMSQRKENEQIPAKLPAADETISDRDIASYKRKANCFVFSCALQYMILFVGLITMVGASGEEGFGILLVYVLVFSSIFLINFIWGTILLIKNIGDNKFKTRVVVGYSISVIIPFFYVLFKLLSGRPL